MERVKVETVDVKVPSGFTITLKKRLTAGDDNMLIRSSMGNMEVQDKQQAKLKLRESYDYLLYNVYYHIVGWDMTENNEALPVTIENFRSSLYDPDIKALNKAIEKFPKVDVKKEIGS